MDQNFKNTSVNIDTNTIVRVILSKLAEPNNPAVKNYTKELTNTTDEMISKSTQKITDTSKHLTDVDNQLQDTLQTITETSNDVKGLTSSNEKHVNKVLKIALFVLLIGVVLTVLGLFNMVVCNIWKAPLLHTMLHNVWMFVGTFTGFAKFIVFLLACIVTLIVCGVPLIAPIGLLILYKIGYNKNWW